MYKPTYCVACGSSNLHEDKTRNGRFQCVDCGCMFRVRLVLGAIYIEVLQWKE